LDVDGISTEIDLPPPSSETAPAPASAGADDAGAADAAGSEAAGAELAVLEVLVPLQAATRLAAAMMAAPSHSFELRIHLSILVTIGGDDPPMGNRKVSQFQTIVVNFGQRVVTIG